MFKEVIKHLRSYLKAMNRIVEDTTGVITQQYKDDLAKRILEFEKAISVLENYEKK